MPKLTFKSIFLIFIVILVILPFTTTFNEFLTRMVMQVGLYRKIQDLIVPWEISLIRVILSFFGIESAGGLRFFDVIKDGKTLSVWISWNCIGWQTFILFAISLFTGLQGPHKLASKLECVVIGFLGTFLMNLFRITLIVLVLYYIGQAPAVVVHDYFSTFIAISWLLFFWWFSFKYVLEERTQ